MLKLNIDVFVDVIFLLALLFHRIEYHKRCLWDGGGKEVGNKL